mgnify:CR=1 FL=1|jgi:hypothetical protein
MIYIKLIIIIIKKGWASLKEIDEINGGSACEY